MKTQKQDLGKVSLTCNGTWDAGKQYDRLCIVNDRNFASYISKKDVPIGTVLSDERFWQPIANLRDDIKIDYETFKKEWLELLASIQIKLRSVRVVVANEEARNNLTWLEVAAGCEVYELDTQLTYILDSIVPVINLKSWHLVVGSLLDSEAKFQLDGTYELTAERAIADRWGYIIDEVYVSKKEVKNLVLSIVNDRLENISNTIPPNSIKPEDLSQAVLDPIGSGGNVVNNPDEEDITSESLSNGTSVLKSKITSDIIVPTSDNISSIDSVTNKEGFFYVYNNSGGGLPLGIISADITVRRITIDKLLKVLIPFDLSYGVWTQVVDLTNSTITKWTPMNKALTRPVSNYSNFDSTDTGALHWDGTSLKIWNGTSWTNVDGTTL